MTYEAEAKAEAPEWEPDPTYRPNWYTNLKDVPAGTIVTRRCRRPAKLTGDPIVDGRQSLHDMKEALEKNTPCRKCGKAGTLKVVKKAFERHVYPNATFEWVFALVRCTEGCDLSGLTYCGYRLVQSGGDGQA